VGGEDGVAEVGYCGRELARVNDSSMQYYCTVLIDAHADAHKYSNRKVTHTVQIIEVQIIEVLL